MGKDFYCAATVSLANKKLFWMSGGFRSVRKLIDPTRPYLHVHENAGEREMQVINLTGSHVITSPEVEMLLKASPLTRHRSRMKIAFCADKEKKKKQRRWAFTVFTPTNSYILQAASENERKEWMSVISTSAN